MKYDLIIRPEAKTDLLDAFHWYQEQRPGLGFDFKLCVDEVISKIQRNPLIHKVIGDGIRRSVTRRFPFGVFYLVFSLIIICLPGGSWAAKDKRILVEIPEMMQQHMMSNMRDHLAAINEILVNLGNDELDKAAEIAEYRLGMSSLESHGASHMAKFMPEGMRQAGTTMHKAASRFALKAQEGDILPAYKALSDITSACVACHSGYRVK